MTIGSLHLLAAFVNGLFLIVVAAWIVMNDNVQGLCLILVVQLGEIAISNASFAETASLNPQGLNLVDLKASILM